MEKINKNLFNGSPRRTISSLVAVLFALGFVFQFASLPALAQTTATLALSPSSQAVANGATFNVSINLNTAGAPVDGVDIYLLHFNASVLQVVDSDAGTAGVQISPGTLMPNTAFNSVNNSTGTIQFSQSTSGGSSFTGSGVLATITFQAIAGGTSAVTFDFTAGSTADTNVAYQGVDRLSAVTNGNYTVDTSAPTAPTGLSATATSSTQINLSWTASTDNVGVTGYRVERCSGASCSSFAQIATPTTTSYSDTGLTAATSYSYRVRATDGIGNLSGYSTTATTSTPAGFDFTIANAGAKTVTQGSNVTNTITATLSSGTTQAVAFTASGMPTGVTASFSPTSCSPTCTSTLTLTASPSATTGNSTITVTGTAGAITHTTTFTLTVNIFTYARTINIASLEALSTLVATGTLNAYNSAKTLLKSYPFTTDSSGNASVTFDIPVQTAYLQVKAAPFLTREISQNLSVTTAYTFPQLLTGDINQDNIINSIDYSLLNTNWFTAAAADDLNKDGIVNSIDFSFMNKHWLISGEQ